MSRSTDRGYTTEFHSTPQLWVAYYCGCSECPKGMGITETAAVIDLLEQCDESFATDCGSTDAGSTDRGRP